MQSVIRCGVGLTVIILISKYKSRFMSVGISYSKTSVIRFWSVWCLMKDERGVTDALSAWYGGGVDRYVDVCRGGVML